MIFVTGSSRLLGAAIAKALAKAGHSVGIHAYQSINDGKEVVAACKDFGVEAHLFIGDLTQSDDFIRRYNQTMPSTTGLVNTVGPYCYNVPSKMLDSLRQLYSLVLEAPIALTEALLPSLQSVVNIGVSNLSSTWTKAASYGLLKKALLNYTQSLAKELTSQQVRVNMVSPSQLPHSLDLLDPAKLSEVRIVELQEVADLVVYLFSKKAHSITGQNIEI